MAQVLKKWLADDAVGAAKMKLENNTYLRARNAADSADVNILKVNASNAIELASVPVVGADTVQTSANKGVANGLATLDGSGKIPSAQLTIDAFQYLGTYNATTNSPALVDGTGNTGDTYRVTTAGSQDFGAGSITFAIGDKVVYNPSGVWEKWDMTESVASVNTQTGAVVLSASHLNYTQANVAHWTVADESTIKATLDEAGSRVTALEAVTQKVPAYQTFTLTGTDITNQFVTLSNTPTAGSIRAFPKGGPEGVLTDDFTVAGAVLTFAGDFATLLASGDKLIVQYLY